MELTKEQVQAFIEAWQKDFGDRLSFEEAGVEAKRLLDFFAAMAEILRRPEFTEVPVLDITVHDVDGARNAWRKMMTRGR